MRTLLIISLMSVFAPQIPADELPSIAVDFDTLTPGILTEKMVAEQFGEVLWASLGKRAAVCSAEDGKVLEVTYPKGKAASEKSGAQFALELGPQRFATLRYRFCPAPDFPFVKGGKLPGLASGGSRFTGGRPPGEEGGWSARYMWRREGALELYFYHPGMIDEYGERHSLETTLIPGEWVELTQKIDTGEPGKKNGLIEIEVNGELKLGFEGLELHGTRYGPVDAFLFSTFFGGSSSSWAPPRETTIRFDDFLISPEKPEFSGE